MYRCDARPYGKVIRPTSIGWFRRLGRGERGHIAGLPADPPGNGAACGKAGSDVDGASVLDQAADRDGSDVAGCRNGLRQGEADVDQR